MVPFTSHITEAQLVNSLEMKGGLELKKCLLKNVFILENEELQNFLGVGGTEFKT